MRVFAVLGVVALAAATAAPACADDVAIAFDQIDFILPAGANVPAPGSFGADYALALKAPDAASQAMALLGGGPGAMGMSLLGSLPGVAGIAAQRAMQAMMTARMQQAKQVIGDAARAGRLTHYAFLNGWARIEIPGTVVEIVKPDAHEAIIAMVGARTYRRIPFDGIPSAAIGPTNGSLHSDVTMSEADRVAIDGAPRPGVKIDYRLQADGLCADAANAIHETAYYGDTPLPALLAGEDDALEPFAVSLRCRPAIVHAVPPPPAPPKLYLYRVIRVEGKLGGTRVSERGNVRALGPADASLFSPPAGFTETR